MRSRIAQEVEHATMSLDWILDNRSPAAESIAMIHHLGVFASDFEASRAFFAAALQALSIVAGYETDDICDVLALRDRHPVSIPSSRQR
jgi:hypothetical protein